MPGSRIRSDVFPNTRRIRENARELRLIEHMPVEEFRQYIMTRFMDDLARDDGEVAPRPRRGRGPAPYQR